MAEITLWCNLSTELSQLLSKGNVPEIQRERKGHDTEYKELVLAH